MFAEKIDFDRRMIAQNAAVCAEAVYRNTGCLERCIGFIDGTVRPMCRPTYHQHVSYNGHKRVHALKFQSVVIPNGLIASLWGPIEGRRHDVALLRRSGIGAKLRDACPGFYLFGDPAYPLSSWLIKPFQRNTRDEAQQLFNRRTSGARISVEWCFGDILRIWAFVDFKKNMKVFLSAIGSSMWWLAC